MKDDKEEFEEFFNENRGYTFSRITELRKKNGWNKQELGYRADIDRSELSKIERGEINITYRTLCKIAKGLGVKLSDLVK